MGEFCFVPVVETMMHIRQAFGPIMMNLFWSQKNQFFTPQRIRSAFMGTPVQIAFYAFLWFHGALLMHLSSGAIVLQLLAFGDAFHHTYEAVFPQDYTPGPGNRTAQFEEENTYSNLIGIRYPLLNLLNLNFSYHNAHHKRPMLPWYQLPAYHNKLYSKNGGKCRDNISQTEIDCPQVLPISEVLVSWYRHRLRRVLEDDYGVVYPEGTPHRARDFVGTLGASFLTV
jgi:fatty acid desaturase